MPGELAAAIDVDDRGAIGRALGVVGATPGRIDRLVLEQNHHVLCTIADRSAARALHHEALFIRNRTATDICNEKLDHEATIHLSD
ncbi:hypothetical protein GCM10011399_34310 [Subtercola lobariae]|uniref:Uncharacterized protein n=1 Tax=Subtercola lobariae TaxID=1588641 RepID=A0A917F2J6_9MICO|nr:hypothetical protein GCM10011399_34310 [Subtercola lobariae]